MKEDDRIAKLKQQLARQPKHNMEPLWNSTINQHHHPPPIKTLNSHQLQLVVTLLAHQKPLITMWLSICPHRLMYWVIVLGLTHHWTPDCDTAKPQYLVPCLWHLIIWLLLQLLPFRLCHLRILISSSKPALICHVHQQHLLIIINKITVHILDHTAQWHHSDMPQMVPLATGLVIQPMTCILFFTLKGHSHTVSFASKSQLIFYLHATYNCNQRVRKKAGNWSSVNRYGQGSSSTTLRHHLAICHLFEWVDSCDKENIAISGDGTFSEMIAAYQGKSRAQPTDCNPLSESPTFTKPAFVDVIIDLIVTEDLVSVFNLLRMVVLILTCPLNFEVYQHHQVPVTVVALSNALQGA